MNKLQKFIEDKKKACGFLTSADVGELAKMDRLFPVLIRCGACRLTCAAQDVAHITELVDKGGDYVRDVSLPAGSFERAAAWTEQVERVNRVLERKADEPRQRLTFDGEPSFEFDESQCGGVFDGRQVTSDADPGL